MLIFAKILLNFKGKKRSKKIKLKTHLNLPRTKNLNHPHDTWAWESASNP